MADNTFDSEELDIQFQPITAYIDGDGSFKLNTPMLSSLDFDGSIPKVEDETLPVTDVMPGFFIKLEEDGDYFVVESVEVDEEFIDSTGLVTINYIDDQGQIVSVDYDDTDTVHVMYEDWAEKILGSRGWGITAGGNAIFTNVAVRGRIEAEEGYISASLTIGSGGSSTVDDLVSEGQLSDGVTIISGGNILTGTVSANRIDVDNLTVRNLETYESSSATRIKINDVNNERHKIYFETGWSSDIDPSTISAAAYTNSGPWGTAYKGLNINAGALSTGATDYGPSIDLRSYSYALNGHLRRIDIKGDNINFSPVVTNSATTFDASGYQYMSLISDGDIDIDSLTNVELAAPTITLTGAVTGTSFSGDGSGLSGVGSPIVVSTSGPSSPSSYADNTVWYVV